MAASQGLLVKINDLKVSELRAECMKMGMDGFGKKVELKIKLRDAIEKVEKDSKRLSLGGRQATPSDSSLDQLAALREEITLLRHIIEVKDTLIEEKSNRVRDQEQITNLLQQKTEELEKAILQLKAGLHDEKHSSDNAIQVAVVATPA